MGLVDAILTNEHMAGLTLPCSEVNEHCADPNSVHANRI